MPNRVNFSNQQNKLWSKSIHRARAEHVQSLINIKLFTPGKNNLKPHKELGMASQINSSFPRVSSTLYLRLWYVPRQWKAAKLEMLNKLHKPPQDPQSYRPMSSFPMKSSSLTNYFSPDSNLSLKKNKYYKTTNLNPAKNNYMLEQSRGVMNEIHNVLESKKFCPEIFLSVKQAFDSVWFRRSLHNVSRYLPAQIVYILQPYLQTPSFQ